MVAMLLSRAFPPADPQASFDGKIVIVTGANTGLGHEAAAKFLEKGAQKVILAVRTISKGEVAKKSIASRYGHEDRMDVWELDMNNYDSIQRFAQRVNDELERVDIAVLNAGVYMTEYKTSSYSWEETLQVNTISTLLLAILLLPKLKRSKTADFTPVLEFTNSGTHISVNKSAFTTADNVLQTLNERKSFNESNQYGSSKLLLMFVTQVLSERIASSTTTIASVCPGATRSDLARGHDGFLMRNIIKPTAYQFFRTQEQGARTLVSGVTLGDKIHGRFWQHDKIQPKIQILEDKALQEKIWNEVVDAIRKDYPGVDKALAEI